MSMLIDAYRFVASGGDPFWNNVSCLLHFNGTNGSTTFTDEKGKTWTAGGNAQISTAQFKFGGASGLFDGSGDLVSTADHVDFEFGSGNFTIECFSRFTSLPGSGNAMTFINKWDSSQLSWFFYLFNNSGTYELYLSYSTNGTTQTNKLVNWTPSTATWYHVVVCRDSANLRFFVDGVQVGTTQNVSTDSFANTSSLVRIAARETNLYFFNGYLDELRVTKGVARYTANFTPPSVEFPNN